MLHTQYERSRLSGFRVEYFLRFSHENQGVTIFGPGGHDLNKLGRGPLGDNTYQTSKH